ncbi:MAG: UbiD family decarboxylase [Chloroflexi bacterium]|nr:UbiD family decarboxylase [Chloroflexota bacterium]
MSYRDLRGWMQEVEDLKEVKHFHGADWNLEVGALCALASPTENCPTLLFDKLKGYPAGYRILVNPLASLKRIALTSGMPLSLAKREYVELWRKKLKEFSLVKPSLVDGGPVMENVHTGKDVDLLEFPSPFWHAGDGGRYVGTATAVITQDPDNGWVNFGTYRVMVVDQNHVVLSLSTGKHGLIQRNKYFDQGKPCPVAISVGHDPVLFMAASLEVPYGVSEYDYAGGIKGKPIEVVKGPCTGLPLPASAEIVLEGEFLPDRNFGEGPFGEWTGYYGGGLKDEPGMVVKAIYHRNDPIILGNFHEKAVNAPTIHQNLIRSAIIHDELEKAGVPDVVAVWCLEVGGPRFLTVVSIKQRYPGHARQAAHIATFCHAGIHMGRYTIVVDDDIDVGDLNEVMWAVCTRTDPEKSIEVSKRGRGSPIDPALPWGHKQFSSRAIIDACRPFEWRDEFPAVAAVSEELRAATRVKWDGELTRP